MEAVEDRELARRLVERHGELFSAQAGIELVDEPESLWQLLVLTQLLSARISASTAIATARELFRCGWTSPEALLASSWNARVAALGRGGYRRYDFSTATRLESIASLLVTRWGGDLRRLRDEAVATADVSGVDDAHAALVARTAALLQAFDGIGPVGASIFLREAQAVWPTLRPVADRLVCKGAAAVGLPEDAEALARLVEGDEFAHLAAALVRVGRKQSLVRELARPQP